MESGGVVPVDSGGGFTFEFSAAGKGRIALDQFGFVESDRGFHERVIQGIFDAADRSGDAGFA